MSEDLKKRKRAEKQEVKQTCIDEKKKKIQGKCKEKKKEKAKKKDKSAASTKNTPVRVGQPAQAKSPVAQHSSFLDPSSSSSSSEEGKASKKPAPKTPSATATFCQQKQKKKPPPSSSSSETSSDEATSIKCPSQKQPPNSKTLNAAQNDVTTFQLTPVEPPSSCAQKQASSKLEHPSQPCTSGSEEEIEFVIRKPVQPPGFGVGGPAWRGFGRRGNNGHFGSTQRGRGGKREGVPQQNGSLDHDNTDAIKPSYQTDSLTNTSVVLQVRYQRF